MKRAAGLLLGLGLPLLAAATALAGCAQEPAPGTATAPQWVQSRGASVDELKAIFPTLQGRHVDPATGQVVLDILAADTADKALSDNKKAAGKLLGAPVRLSVLPAPLQPQATP
ncbi:hypothetical protein [Isoalcanivorax beigongshangi]|uniref:Uncharacterized protein n=1 Tax=Isoalcanivorax beigongshangi TaxID=3238810 RepID=A0ABV4ALQ3_9GAMM